MDKCSKVFVPVRVLFLPPISPHAIDKHNFISTRDLLEGFYYFYMGRVAMFTCVCMRMCVCVCVHVTVFRSAFLFVVRVNEWKTLEREQDIYCVFVCVCL